MCDHHHRRKELFGKHKMKSRIDPREDELRSNAREGDGNRFGLIILFQELIKGATIKTKSLHTLFTSVDQQAAPRNQSLNISNYNGNVNKIAASQNRREIH